jgi:hypothetical protein
MAAAVLLLTTARFTSAEEPRASPLPSSAEQKPSMVSVEQGLYLIRSTLLTLNDANRSGNYSVLRDLAAPGFQAKNSSADLAEYFSDLRRRHFDLFSVAIAAPQLTSVPTIDGNKMLRLTGYFPTIPLQIHFDLLFQNAGDEWRVFAISVATPKAPSSPAPSADTSPANTGKSSKVSAPTQKQ